METTRFRQLILLVAPIFFICLVGLMLDLSVIRRAEKEELLAALAKVTAVESEAEARVAVDTKVAAKADTESQSVAKAGNNSLFLRHNTGLDMHMADLNTNATIATEAEAVAVDHMAAAKDEAESQTAAEAVHNATVAESEAEARVAVDTKAAAKADTESQTVAKAGNNSLFLRHNTGLDMHLADLNTNATIATEADVHVAVDNMAAAKAGAESQTASEAGNNSLFLRHNTGLDMHLAELNPNATIASDIIKITHIRNESKIIVHLRKERNCRNPQLIGRLSGPALSKMDWRTDLYERKDEDLKVGYYHVPVRGHYFIEIIVITCIQFYPDSEMLEIKSVCVEDPRHHRLTHKNASISVDKSTSGIHNTSLGYWFNRKNNENDYVPLYTRYQLPECFVEVAKQSRRCVEEMDTARFEPYAFEFAKEFNLSKHLEGKHGRVCFQGASHSRYFTEMSESLLQNHSTIDARHHKSLHAEELMEYGVIQEWINNSCTKVVIGTGQWDASWSNSHPTPGTVYEAQLEKAMSNIVEFLQNTTIDIFFRSTHYNPLNAIITKCPPDEWRNPVVFDMYNQITKRLCKKFNIPLIETYDIVSPVWDSSSDWCHVLGDNLEKETMYVLHEIFSDK